MSSHTHTILSQYIKLRPVRRLFRPRAQYGAGYAYFAQGLNTAPRNVRYAIREVTVLDAYFAQGLNTAPHLRYCQWQYAQIF